MIIQHARYFIACIIIACAAASPAFPLTGTPDKTSHVTIMTNLKPEGCSENEATTVTDSIRSFLPDIPNCFLVLDGEMKPALAKAGLEGDCRDIRCAVVRGRIVKGHRAITGSVKKVVIKREERSDTPGKERYLIRIITEIRYVITLELINVRSGAVMAVLEETTEKEDTAPAVKRLIERLARYYEPRGVKDEKEKVVDIGDKAATRPGLSLYYSTLVPVYNFGNSSKAGVGVLIDFGTTNFLFNNSALRIQAGYHNLLDPMDSIKAMHMLTVTALAGYSFVLPKDFLLTPLAGGGYLFNFVNGDARSVRYNNIYRYTWSTYYNPFIAVKLELDYDLTKGFHLVFTPGYTLLFEKKEVGNFFTFDVGARHLF